MRFLKFVLRTGGFTRTYKIPNNGPFLEISRFFMFIISSEKNFFEGKGKLKG
jgi:hypothetical protein